ncbi:carbohydrate ABC transporter permease [Metabacillus halosaccharovorans]|uniref:Carbohydrate ABC transporter permease n=1 Tax=Metabacillus halosaccharovorans TaxID=930124 RepID=A0ABT3DD98_9BACI|nr:carbohydrate ABC transporter permease [Metabacillus halosaccharovorans]MCV9885028.1 carbohydrate ABC transporter permease [Metabacillus halosaccharovorans]
MLKTIKQDIWSHLFLIVLAFIALYPFFYMIITSFKTNGQFYSNFFGITFPLHFENYAVAWEAIGGYIFNSVFVGVASVLIIITTSALAGYSFARLRFKGKNFLYMSVVALLMIPGLLTLIPLFLLVKSFGLLDSYMGLIIAFAAGGQAFTIFVFRQSFASLPEELFEAARIDGCGELRVFWQIVLPLSKPIIGTMAIWNLLAIWNEYMMPLVLLSDPTKFPITVGLIQFESQFVSQTLYGPMFAGYTIASLPLLILFLFTMRLFMKGLTSGAVKI